MPFAPYCFILWTSETESTVHRETFSHWSQNLWLLAQWVVTLAAHLNQWGGLLKIHIPGSPPQISWMWESLEMDSDISKPCSQPGTCPGSAIGSHSFNFWVTLQLFSLCCFLGWEQSIITLDHGYFAYCIFLAPPITWGHCGKLS